MPQIAKQILHLRVWEDEHAEQLLLITVKGVIGFKPHHQPRLIKVQTGEKNNTDGILDFNLVIDEQAVLANETEIEVNLVIDKNELPKWVKAIRVNARDNFDIEML